MTKVFTRLIGMATFCLFLSFNIMAQSTAPLAAAQQYIEEQHEAWGLQKEDIADLQLDHFYTDKSTGITRYFFVQRYLGIEVMHATINVGVTKEGRISNAGHKLIANLEQKVNSHAAHISAAQAVEKAMSQVKVAHKSLNSVQQVNSTDAHHFEFGNKELLQHNIKTKLCYHLIDNGQLKLSWNSMIYPKGSVDTWRIWVDAKDGQLLKKENLTSFCNFGSGHEGCKEDAHQHFTSYAPTKKMNNTSAMGHTYNVFKFPIESPSHGDRSMVTDPADIKASPFGWHDTDGMAGDEYNITRGNNTHAYQDRNGDGQSEGDEPDGGMDMTFDYQYDSNDEPIDHIDAATVNLFYAVNAVHDFSYRHGFTEETGNFQENNYGNGGADNDQVNARVQSDAVTGPNGRRTNNATFGPIPDGFSPFISMFVWTKDFANNQYIKVNEPSEVSGLYETGITVDGGTTWAWGSDVTQNPITGNVVLYDDGAGSKTDGCQEPVNGGEIDGNIVLIDRGSCEFGLKAIHAQRAGAIGVIICNVQGNGVGNMGPGVEGGDVEIPVLMLGLTDCQKVRVHAGNGLNVTFEQPDFPGPEELDGDFDNGIIAHEYGHGISSRLTGGPNELCISNEESASEGWSDFFTLVMTVEPGDKGSDVRGIGTFVSRDPITGTGFRPYPYSTDRSINPSTYNDIANYPAPSVEDSPNNRTSHGVGFVFCTMLWDMYWAFVDKYDFDPNLDNTESGNYKAVRLVIEGLKTQTCTPGFVDSRDAILQADKDLNNGENQGLIWEVFAARGLGVGADQGSSTSTGDGDEDYEIPAELIPTLKISKTVSPLIDAGENIKVDVTVRNDKTTTATGVVYTDAMLTGTAYMAGSISNGLTANTNGNMLSVDLPELATGEQYTFSYELTTVADKYSIRIFHDPVDPDEVDDLWFDDIIVDGDPNTRADGWLVTDQISYDGDYAWRARDTNLTSNVLLFTQEPISVIGQKPVLRFYHQYNMEKGYDGTAIEITADDDVFDGQYTSPQDAIFRNPYDKVVPYGTFVLPNFKAFTGSTDGWLDTYVDLKAFRGELIYPRFRLATDGGESVDGGGFWIVDEIEVMDMVNYNSESCISDDASDMACAVAGGGGTVIESQEGTVSANNLGEGSLKVFAFPNPATEQFNLTISSEKQMLADLSLMTTDGRRLDNRQLLLNNGTQSYSLNVSKLPAGMYLVRIQTEEGVIVKKMMKQ